MLGEQLKTVPSGESGVYCMFDLDGEPAYAGRSSDLRSRLRQHFVRQDSSVVSYGRLDIWDIGRVDWWQTPHDKDAEEQLLAHYRPYLNFEEVTAVGDVKTHIDPTCPDDSVALASDDEQRFRSEPYNRTKQKLEHISRMVDKIKLSGHSDDTKRTLYEHERILRENLAEFLDIDAPGEQSTLSIWDEE
ncbi:GIY-YIG nuclease family protein [Haloferax prahovense]|uniref:hypothetical protein n=1 Tax=Haloferax prahovense TaxID=381852 RepID=UPI000678B6F4|nr:hypothetical protein [Haloferax prahovense]